MLNFFAQGGFEYTLTPQRLGRDSIDELLFSTRQGFCGHYASAFVDLMRAGGVPARVVTGYQGGEWNPIGHYLTVRQSDAHAWAEVWLPERGWLRADPTAVVAPQRLSREMLAFEDSGGDGERLRGSARWLAIVLQTWDTVNFWWQDDVVGFNFTRQLKVANWLGFGDRDWQTLAVALGVGMGAGCCGSPGRCAAWHAPHRPTPWHAPGDRSSAAWHAAAARARRTKECSPLRAARADRSRTRGGCCRWHGNTRGCVSGHRRSRRAARLRARRTPLQPRR